MTTPFSESEVIRRTARRLGTNDTRVRNFLDTFTEEWIRHARETEPDLIRGTIAMTAAQEITHEAPAKPAGKARSPRKAATKARTPAKAKATAQGDSEGNALIESQMLREAEASVKLDGETHVVG